MQKWLHNNFLIKYDFGWLEVFTDTIDQLNEIVLKYHLSQHRILIGGDINEDLGDPALTIFTQLKHVKKKKKHLHLHLYTSFVCFFLFIYLFFSY